MHNGQGHFSATYNEKLAIEGFTKMTAGNSWTFKAAVDKDTEATATVTALSANDVKVKIDAGQLPYKQAEKAVYEFKGTVTYDNVDYAVAFNVTLGAMPADQDINLGEISTVGNTTADMVENINALFKIREVINAADNNFNKDITYENYTDLTDLVKTADAKAAEKDAVTVNGTEVTSTSAAGYATIALAAGLDEDDDEVMVDASTITITKVANYENTINVVKTVKVCGINFTIKATVVTTKANFTFKPSTAFVSDDMKVNLPGNVSFKYSDAKKLKTETSVPYALNAIDLSDYVTVTIPEDYVADYQVRYTLVSNPLAKYENGAIKEWLANPESTTTPKEKFSAANLPVMPNGKVLDSHYTAIGEDVALTWRTDMREMTYEIALVSKTKVDADNDGSADDDNVIDSFEVTLVVPELLTLTASDVTVNCFNGNVENKSANVIAGLNLVDVNGNTAYNPYALNLDQIWNGYDVKVATDGSITSRTITSDTFFNVYGQDIAVVEPAKVKAYIGDEDVTASVNPSVTENGTVTLNPQSGAIQKPVTVKVPVKVTYLYDEYGTKAETATVNVVFNPQR